MAKHMKYENISFHEVIEILKNKRLKESDVNILINSYTKKESKLNRIFELIKLDKKAKHPFHY